MREALTSRQQQALTFISDSIMAKGYPPTLREIGVHMQIRSTNGVNDHLKALERKGYLVRDDLKSRALRPLEAPAPSARRSSALDRSLADVLQIPLIGRVAAGEPILAEQYVEDHLAVDRSFLGVKAGLGEDVFALRVVGESMIEDGIFDRDLVFVRQQRTAERGDIVVAMIDGEATVKRYYPEGDHIRFQPANAAMEPIVIARGDFQQVDLVGVVIGVFRSV